jgi:diguanylate cyclase (GGDEF)-like protein/PAS domain S-box-containing protein
MSDLAAAPRQGGDLARGAALAAGYYLLAQLSLALPAFDANVTFAWLPAGVALAGLLLWGMRLAPAVFVGALAVNLTIWSSLTAAVAVALGSTLAAVAGAWLCAHAFRIDVRLATIRDTLVLVFGGGAGASTIAATIGVLVLTMTGSIAPERAGTDWLVWWAGDAQGVLFVAPLALAWAARPRLDRAAVEAGVLSAGLGAAMLAIGVLIEHSFGAQASQYVLALAMLPLLLWPAMHYAIREVTLLNFMLGTVCVAATAAGVGPFVTKGAAGAVALHGLLSLIALTTLLLAARSGENRDAARRLADSEARFRSLTALSADWYWEQDAHLRFTGFSSEFGARAGVDARGFIGRTRGEVAAADPADPAWAEHLRLLESRNPFRDFLIERKGRGGETRYHLISGEPVFDAAGRFAGYRGVGRDVTEEKRAALALAASRELFARLFEGGPLPMMFRRLHDGVVTAVNDAWCAFYGRSRESVIGRPVATLGFNPDPATSARLQERLVRERSVRDAELSVFGTGGALRDTLFTASVVHLGGEDIVISTSVDVTERNRARAELLSSRERFEKLFRSSPQPTAISGIDDGAVIDVSDAWLSTYGYAREAVLGRDFVALGLWVDPEERRVLRERLLAQGAVRGLECRWRRASGEVADVLFYADVVTLDGHPVMLSTGIDITARRRQERLLAESESRFVTIFRASPVPVIISQLDDGEYVEVNEAWSHFFGWPREETLGRASLALGIWVDLADRERFVASLVQKGFHSAELRLRKKSGEVCDVVLSAGVIELAGRRCALSAVLDISERKRAEAALRESERRFRDFAEAAGEYVWEVDAGARFTYVSRRVESVLGYAPEELYGRTLLDFMPPGETERMRQWYDDTAAARTSFRNVEHRMLARSGSQVWQSLSGVPLLDGAGELTGWRGTALDITERKRAEARIADLATRDPLTGLPNRLLLADRLGQALTAAQREGAMLAVMFVDLDHFKTINDTLGHEVGDLLLKEVAGRIGSVLRKGDTLARLGGDEFVVVLERLKRPEDAAQVANKIIAGLAEDIVLAGQPVRTAASIGVAVFPADGADASTLMRHADTAMYVAKSSGRGNCQFFSTEMTSRASERMQLDASLQRALDRGELRLLFQPRVEVQTGQLAGIEALLRWQHPERGLLAAGQFMRFVDESGLAHAVGDWVLNSACSQASALHAVYGAEFALSVNVSARQLNPGVVARVMSALEASSLDPRLLELELTEEALIRDAQQARGILSRLRAIGVRIVVDDFGVGHSSLGDLRRFGVDGIKIDRSLVRGIVSNPDDRIVVKATIDMARSLRINTVAEGVEDAETLALLRDMGCEEYSGHLRAEPMPAGEFERRFLRLENVVTFPKRG